LHIIGLLTGVPWGFSVLSTGHAAISGQCSGGPPIIAATNHPLRNITGVRPEVSVLDAVMSDVDVILLNIDSLPPNGTDLG
jgi:hypothetical protein